MKTVSSVRSKIEKYRWENKKRTYEGDLEDLKFLYWHIVTHEILADGKLAKGDPDYFKSMMCKIEGSYRGIFYKYFEINPDLKERFDGLDFNNINKEKELWKSWKEEAEHRSFDIFYEIIRVIKHALGNQRFMVETPMDPDYAIGLKAFSEHGTDKTISITEFLRNHRLYKINVASSSDNSLTLFRYTLKRPLISKLHKLGERLMKEICMIDVLSQCDRQLDYYDTTVKKYKKGDIYELRVSNSVSAFKKMTLKAAIEDFLKSYPGFENLSLSQIKYHLKKRYRDSEGKKFKNNSVDKALRTTGFSN